MSTFEKVGKKVRKMGEKVGEKFGTSKSIKKYAKPFSGKNYFEIEKCLIEFEPAELKDIYSGYPEKVSGTTTGKQECLKKFADKRVAEEVERIKRKKISQITDDDLLELKPAIESRKFKELKIQIEKSKKYLQKIEDGRTKYTGEEMFDPLRIERFTKVDTSKVPGSDESDEMHTPKIIIEEPTIEDILDTNGKAYINWRSEILSFQHGFKGGKSRKMNRKRRRQRKTRRY